MGSRVSTGQWWSRARQPAKMLRKTRAPLAVSQVLRARVAPSRWVLNLSSIRFVVLLTAVCCLLAATTFAQDDLGARREQIVSLPLSDQQQLLRNQERFNELGVDEQERLRKLHEDLSHDANAARLRAVLERYHEWLKTLSPEQRAELAELGTDERVVRIGQLMAREREEHERRKNRFAGEGPPLPREDVQAISRWFGELAWQHREELLADMPSQRREQIEKLDEPAQRRSLTFAAFSRWRNGPLPVKDEDLDRLMKELTPGTRERLAQADGHQRRRVLKDLLRQTVMSRMGSPSMRRSWAMVSNEELERFFQHDLPEGERQRLMRLSREQMRDELRTLYLERGDRPEGPPGRRPPFGPPGGRPGGPGGPDFRRRPPRERGEQPPERSPRNPGGALEGSHEREPVRNGR